MLVIFGLGFNENQPAQTWRNFKSKIVASEALLKTHGLIDQSANDVRLVKSIVQQKDMNED